MTPVLVPRKMRSGLWGSEVRLRTSPPSGPIAAHWPAQSVAVQIRITAIIINNLPDMALEIMCVSTPVADKYTLRFESDSLLVPLQVTLGQQKNRPIGVTDRPWCNHDY